MADPIVQPLQIHIATAGEGAGGTANKALLGAGNTSGNDLSTKANFGTTTTVRYIQAIPGTTNATAATPGAATNKGWNIPRPTMNIPIADRPGKRRVVTGTWTFNFVWEGSTADTNTGFGIQVRVYRLNADNTFTELFNRETIGLSMVAGTADVDVQLTGVAEQLFDTDETLHMEVWIRGRGGGATSLLNQTISLHVGQPTLRQRVEIALPANIQSRYTRTVAPTCRGVPTSTRRIRKTVAPTARGSPTLTRRAVVHRTMAVTGRATPTLARAVRFRRSLLSSARVIPTVRRRIARALAVTARGVPTIRRRMTKRLAPTARGVPTLLRRSTLKRAFTVTGRGVPTLSRRVIARRVLAVTGHGVPSISRHVRRRLTATARGVPTVNRRTTRRLTTSARGAPTMVRKLVARRTLTSSARGVAALTRRVTARRTVVATARAVPRILAKLPIERIPRPEGGPTVIKRLLAIFDD